MTTRPAPTRTRTSPTTSPHTITEAGFPPTSKVDTIGHAEHADDTRRGWSRGRSLRAVESHRRRETDWTSAPAVVQPTEAKPHAAAHLDVLLAAGWTIPRLSRELGIARQALQSLRSGHTVAPHIVARVSAMPMGAAPGQSLAPALGAYRRVHALTAMGWSLDQQARALGVTLEVLDDLSPGALIEAGLWLDIARLYDRYSMVPGPHDDLRNRVRAAGVTPPLGWDDDELDHPAAVSHARDTSGGPGVDPVVVDRRSAGDAQVAMNRSERAALADLAVSEAWPAARLAVVLGISEESASRNLRRWRAARCPEEPSADLPVADEADSEAFVTESVECAEEPSADELAELELEVSDVLLRLWADTEARLPSPAQGRNARRRRRSRRGAGGARDPDCRDQLALDLAVSGPAA